MGETYQSIVINAAAAATAAAAEVMRLAEELTAYRGP